METKKVKKSLILIVMLVLGLIFFTPVFASDEAGEGASSQGATGEEIVAMCEDKFSPENYADEGERNNLIDACINEATGSNEPKEES